MKTISPKTLVILIVISLFSITIFANGLEFRIRAYDPDKQMVSEDLTKSFKIHYHEGVIEFGEFDNYLFAMKSQYILEEMGFKSTTIVAYFNYVEISLDDAFVLLDNRNEQDQKMTEPMSVAEMDLALRMVQNENFYYSIQIGVYSEEAVNMFFDFPKTIDESITQKGYYRYTYGKFNTLQDAKDALVMLQENYFEKAFVIAFDELERIPITAALEKEQRLLEESIAAVSP